MEQKEKIDTEKVTTYEGEDFCNKDKLITVDIKNFNPEDNRIRVLIVGFLEKAKKLGYKTEEPSCVDTKGTEMNWNSGKWELWISSY
jgi:hypothetical protein